MFIKSKSSERIGTVRFNKYGSKMFVVEYNSCVDIWVKFVEHGNRTHTSWKNFSNGEVRNVYDRTTYGIGYIGEGEYTPTINGKETRKYKTWVGMLERCYNELFQKKRQSYVGCSVSEEWHNFQNFAKWYDENYYEIDGEKIHLDKDIMVKGNKVYSPKTCIFVPQSINSLFVKRESKRGKYPIGVHYMKANYKLKYLARCSDSKGKDINLGQYSKPEEAFNTYKEFKENVIKGVANDYKDKIPNELYEAMITYTVKIDD